MTWLAQNWIWVLFGIAFVAMHLFGHGAMAATAFTVVTARIKARVAIRAPSQRVDPRDRAP